MGATWLENNVAVVSATLGHIEHYTRALQNVFMKTKDLVVLRTFVGDVSLVDSCRTECAD